MAVFGPRTRPFLIIDLRKDSAGWHARRLRAYRRSTHQSCHRMSCACDGANVEPGRKGSGGVNSGERSSLMTTPVAGDGPWLSTVTVNTMAVRKDIDHRLIDSLGECGALASLRDGWSGTAAASLLLAVGSPGVPCHGGGRCGERPSGSVGASASSTWALGEAYLPFSTRWGAWNTHRGAYPSCPCCATRPRCGSSTCLCSWRQASWTRCGGMSRECGLRAAAGVRRGPLGATQEQVVVLVLKSTSGVIRRRWSCWPIWRGAQVPASTGTRDLPTRRGDRPRASPAADRAGTRGAPVVYECRSNSSPASR